MGSLRKGLSDNGDFDGIQSEPHETISDCWWSNKWIPFTYNGFGDHYCLDLDPTVKGIKGQVITMWHDMPERNLLANSLSDWLESYVDGLYSGNYEFFPMSKAH